MHSSHLSKLSQLSQERWVNFQLSRSRFSQVSWERWINILCCNHSPGFWESWDLCPSFPRKSCSFSQIPHLHEILGIPANSWENPNFCPAFSQEFQGISKLLIVTQSHISAARNPNCYMIFKNHARCRRNDANSLKCFVGEDSLDGLLNLTEAFFEEFYPLYFPTMKGQ